MATRRAALRRRLLGFATAAVQYMRKAPMQMNLQLHYIVFNITKVTGMLIIPEL